MPVIKRDLPWRRQPDNSVRGIDWSNPLSQGLLIAVLPHTPVNYVNGEELGVWGSFDRVDLDQGVAVSGGKLLFPPPASISAPEARYDLDSGTAFIYSVQPVETNFGYTFFRGNGSSRMGWSVGLYGGSYRGITGNWGTFSAEPRSGGPTPTIPRAAAITADGSNAVAYLDGAVEGSGAYTPTTNQYSAPWEKRQVQFGTAGPTDLNTNARPFVGFLWDRPLSADEVRSVSDNPWQLFAPQSIWVPVSVGGGGGTQGISVPILQNNNIVYSHTIDTVDSQTLLPNLYTNTNSFYTHNISTGAVNLTPGLFSNTNNFYSATVGRGAVNLTAALFSNTNNFYSTTVGRGAVNLTAGLFSNTNSFYTHNISTGAVNLTPGLFSNTNNFYSATLGRGAVNITAALFSNTNTFNSHIISTGALTLLPNLYTNTNSFYTHNISTGAVTITPGLFSNTNNFYSATVGKGAVNLTAALFSNTNTFNSHIISTGALTLLSSLYTNTNSFYTHNISTGAVTLTPGLFSNTNNFYNHVISAGSSILLPSLYTNNNTFYTATLALNITVPKFDNINQIYSPTVGRGSVNLSANTFYNSNTVFTSQIDTTRNLVASIFVNNSTYFTHNIFGSTQLLPEIYNNSNQFYPLEITPGTVILLPSYLSNTNSFFVHYMAGGVSGVGYITGHVIPSKSVDYYINTGKVYTINNPQDTIKKELYG